MFKKLINKESVNVVVHGGCFHADDVACVALLKLLYKEVHVIRKFKMDTETESADYILDIGRMDKITENQVFLDHHQGPELIPCTEIKHCAFSKLTEHMIEPGDVLFKKYLYNTLVLPVAAQDNGQNGADFGLYPSPLSFVNSMEFSWKDDQKLADQRFNEVVDMAMKVISNIIKNLEDKIEAIDEVTAAIIKMEDCILVFDRYLPWVDSVIEYNAGKPKVKLAIYPSNRGGYNIQVVPKKVGSFDSWLKIPEEITNFEGCSGQAHNAFAFFDTVEHAIAAAKQLVNA